VKSCYWPQDSREEVNAIPTCRCGGCEYTFRPDTGNPDFDAHCEEATRLLDVRAPLWTAEGYAAHCAYMTHTREAWPPEWFAPDGHYVTSKEIAARRRGGGSTEVDWLDLDCGEK